MAVEIADGADPLAALVAELTTRWGNPSVRPPQTVTGRSVERHGLLWANLGHHGLRRCWVWFPGGGNHNLALDLRDGHAVITMNSPGRRVTLEGKIPSDATISAAAACVLPAGAVP